jgi:Ca2+-binding EF-hand superfamily protein
MASPKDHGKNKEHLKSASEGSRRKAMQHNLKQMKNLEAAKQEVGADNRRGDSIVACRALFDRIDVDGSGTLDRNEISMLATKMGRGLKAEELDAAMAAMDKDGNGTVDFDEFYSWYSGSSRSMGKAEVKVLAYL